MGVSLDRSDVLTAVDLVEGKAGTVCNGEGAGFEKQPLHLRSEGKDLCREGRAIDDG